jgi:hypothetical protein
VTGGAACAAGQATWGLLASLLDVHSLVGGRVSALGCRSVARSGPRRLVLPGNRQSGAGLRHRTALVASAVGVDLVGSESWRVVSAWLYPPGAVHRRRTAPTTSSVFWLDCGGFGRGDGQRADVELRW